MQSLLSLNTTHMDHISFGDMLRNAVANDIISQSRVLHMSAGAPPMCSACDCSILAHRMVLQCSNPECPTKIHASCLTAAPAGLLYLLNGKITFECPAHGTSPHGDAESVEISHEAIAVFSLVESLINAVCPVLEQLSLGAADVGALELALQMLSDASCESCFQPARFSFSETLQMFHAWRRRLQREIDQYFDFSCSIENTQREINKFHSKIEAMKSDPYSIYVKSLVGSDLYSLRCSIQYTRDLTPKVAVSSALKEDNEHCHQLLQIIVDTIGAFNDFTSQCTQIDVDAFMTKIKTEIIVLMERQMGNMRLSQLFEPIRAEYARILRQYIEIVDEVRAMVDSHQGLSKAYLCEILDRVSTLPLHCPGKGELEQLHTKCLDLESQCHHLLNSEDSADIPEKLKLLAARIDKLPIVIAERKLISNLISNYNSVLVLMETIASVESRKMPIEEFTDRLDDAEMSLSIAGEIKTDEFKLPGIVYQKAKHFLEIGMQMANNFINSDTVVTLKLTLNTNYREELCNEVTIKNLHELLNQMIFSCQESEIAGIFLSIVSTYKECKNLLYQEGLQTDIVLARCSESNLRCAIFANDKSNKSIHQYSFMYQFMNKIHKILDELHYSIETAAKNWKQIDIFVSDCQVNQCQVSAMYFSSVLKQALMAPIINIEVKTRAMQLLQMSLDFEREVAVFMNELNELGIISTSDNTLYLKLCDLTRRSSGLFKTNLIAALNHVHLMAMLYRRTISNMELAGDIAFSLFESVESWRWLCAISIDSITPDFIRTDKLMHSIKKWLAKSVWSDRLQECDTIDDVALVTAQFSCPDFSSVKNQIYLDCFSRTNELVDIGYTVIKFADFLLGDMESSCMTKCNEETLSSEMTTFWETLCSCAYVWLRRIDQPYSILSSICWLVINSSLIESNCSYPTQFLNSIRCSQQLYLLVSECCRIVNSLNSLVQNQLYAFENNGYFSVDLLKHLFKNKSAERSATFLLETDISVEDSNHVVDLHRLEEIAASLSGIELHLRGCVDSLCNLSYNIFLSYLQLFVFDMVRECTAWRDTVTKKFPGGLKRRTFRQVSTETSSAKSLEMLVQHPLPIMVRIYGREEMVQLYKHGQMIAKNLKQILFNSDDRNEPPDFVVYSGNFDSGIKHFEEASTFPFLPIYDQDEVSWYINAFKKSIESMELYPYFLSESLVAKWVVGALNWLQDFCNAWIESENVPIIPYEDCEQLLLRGSCICTVDSSSDETIEVLKEIQVYVDGNINSCVRGCVRAAVTLLAKFQTRFSALKTLSSDAQEIMCQPHTSETKLQILVINDQISALNLEPRRQLRADINIILSASAEQDKSAHERNTPEFVDLKVASIARSNSIVKSIPCKKDLHPNSMTETGNLKRKSTDLEYSLKSLIDGRHQLSVAWVMAVQADRSVSAYIPHHVDLVSVPPVSIFLKSLDHVVGLPLSMLMDQHTPTLSNGGTNAEIAELFSLSERFISYDSDIINGAVVDSCTAKRTLSIMPSCAASVFEEKLEIDGSDGQWEKVRDGVKHILEGILISELVGLISLSYSADLCSISSVIARGTIISAELEEELHYFNNVQDSCSNLPIRTRRQNYQKHSIAVSKNLPHNKALVQALLSGECSVLELVKLRIDDLLSNCWKLKPNEAVPSIKVVSSDVPQSYITDSISTNTAPSCLGSGNGERIDPQRVFRQGSAHVTTSIRKTLDLIKVPKNVTEKMSDSPRLCEIDSNSQHLNVGDAKKQDFVSMDTAIECPLVCLTNDTGTNDISFEWKKKIIFSGVCGAPEKELAAVTYSPFRRGIEIKGRLRASELDKHLLETRDRIMPFIFVFNSGINTNYSDFLNYLNGTHVALCEEFSEHGKFWVYIIPPALFSSMHSVRNLKCVAKLASYEHDHGVILRQHNYQWLYCLHVHNHSVDTIYKHVQHSLPKDSFPPAEILKILSTEIAKCGPPNLNDDYLVPTEVTELVPNSDISNADQFCKVIVESQEDKISDHNEQQENSRSRSPDYRDDVRPSSCEAVRLQPNKSRMRRSRSREYEKSRSPDAFRNRRSRSRNNDQGRKRSRSRDRQWDNTSRSDDKVASAPKYSKTNSSFHSYSQGVIRDSNLTASSSESETDSIKDLHLFMDGIMTGTAPRIDARTVKKKVSSHSIPSKSK